jgi:hypothetical protein
MTADKSPPPVMPPATPEPAFVKPQGGFWRGLSAVAWSFLGVRKDSEFQQDSATLKPLQLMAVGIAAVFVLVIGLMGLVKILVPWVARH